MKKNQIIRKWNALPLTMRVSLAYTISSVFQRCLSIITLPLFTRLLTQEQYGQQTIYSSWQGLLVIFLTLHLPYGSFSTAMVKFEDRRDEYIASVEGIFLLLSISFIVIYLPFSAYWNKLFQLPTFIVVLMIAEILCSSSISLWNGKKRFEYKYKEVIALTIGTLIATILLQLILVLNFDERGYARIVGSASVAIIAGGYIFVKGIIRGKRIFDRELWKYAFGFNIPLLVYYLSQMIFNMSDKIMISHMTGVDKAAIYGVAYNLAIMLNFVLVSINNSYVPWFYEKLKENNQKENKIVANAIAVLMAVLLLGIIWFAPEIIGIMAGKSYMEAIWVVPPVAMSILLLFYAQLSANYEFYYEKKGMLVKASIGAAVTNIVLNYFCIPVFGYCVAGYTTFISYLIFAAMNYRAMLEIAKEKELEDHGLDVKGLIVILFAFVIVGFLGVALYDFLYIRIIIAGIIAAYITYNRNKLFEFWSIIKRGN